MNDEKLIINKGFFRTFEDTCFLYKILDVKLERSLLERMFGIGTIICYTGDSTDPQLVLKHIKKSKEIKEFKVFKENKEFKVSKALMAFKEFKVSKEFRE